MALRTRIHVVCDLCEEPLCWPPDENEDHYSDGRNTRFFDCVVTAETAAIASGWKNTGPVIGSLQCPGCQSRTAAMHAWIKANRLVDHGDG